MRAIVACLSVLGLGGCPNGGPLLDDDDSGDDDTAADDDTGDDDTGDDDTGDDDTGDDDTGDDDTGDDDTGDDDTVDPPACVAGWRPRGVVPVAQGAWINGFAVHEATQRLAISTGDALELWDIADPGAPALVVSLDSLQVGSWGRWGDVVGADDGFFVGGESAVGPMAVWHALLIDAVDGAVAGRSTVPHPVSLVGADADSFVATGTEQLTWFGFDGSDLVVGATRDLPDGFDGLTGLGVHGSGGTGEAIVSRWSSSVAWVSSSPDAQTFEIAVPSHPHAAVWFGGGWIVPQTTNGWVGGDAGLGMLSANALTPSWLLELPWISAFDGDDGPHEVVVVGDQLVVANSESGLLRGTWDPDALSIPYPSTLTPAVWPDVPTYPHRVDGYGTLVAVSEEGGDRVGLVEICDP